jgi:hypothetical protein
MFAAPPRCYRSGVKLALALALPALALVGCMERSGGYYPDPGPQPIGTTGSCTMDADCGGGGQVCARDGGCYPSTEVRAAVVTWTLHGQPASTSTCANSNDLQLDFGDDANRYGFGFAPVPCVEGRFSIDKLPTFYISAQLGKTSAPGAVAASIDPSKMPAQAAIDLPF